MLTSALCSWERVAPGALNCSTDPPLKSTLKFSHLVDRATMAISRISPEIVYQVRWRPTKLIDTSPR